MKKIDILMATYNGEKYLKEQLDSILNQTYNDFNLIISDDFSTDNTKNILNEYAKKDDRIKLIFNSVNVGSNKNFNNLLKEVKSEYFMFCDQDDVWYNTKIEDTLNKMVSDNSDMVFTDLEVVDNKLNLIAKSFNKIKKYDKKIRKYSDIRLVYLYNVVTGCTILCKAKYINEILKFTFNRAVLHDNILALVVSSKGKVSYLNKPTLKYRQHNNNQVGTKRYVDKFNDFYDIRNHMIDVKINLFRYYIENGQIFDERTKKVNIKALEYYNLIKEKRNFNFSKISIFNKLYKNEGVILFFAYFCIMNLPFLTKILFSIKEKIKRV